MKHLFTPRRLESRVPEDESEDISEKFSSQDEERLLAYYKENGYVVVRGCVDPQLCDDIRKVWDTEVKPYKGYMYRQASAKVEKHVFNEKGWVMNPILNLQSVDPSQFPTFRKMATEKILAGEGLERIFRLLIGDKPKIVQSMYFEGNSATWEHQDSYYLDSENIGSMAAAWIAIEDIAVEAGRFFISPRSHKIDLIRQQRQNNIADNHEGYIQEVVARIKKENLEVRAPFLKKGDVLFWNSCTIHGSMDTQDLNHSRSSITCHAIPAKDKFLQWHTRVLDVKTDAVNGSAVYRPKDLARLRNRLVFSVEQNFPKAFYGLKKMAVRWVTSRQG